jgi:hypothetical protein
MTTETSLASTMVHLGHVSLAAPNWAQRMHRSHDWLPALFTRSDPSHVGTAREQALQNRVLQLYRLVHAGEKEREN